MENKYLFIVEFSVKFNHFSILKGGKENEKMS